MTEGRGRRLQGQRGAALVIAIVMLLILAILSPALVYLVQNESRATVKQRRATHAFYAAEAGIDRALWKLRSDPDAYQAVLDGGPPAGYLGDVIYSDVEGASYVVTLNSTTVSKEIRIEASGRDDQSKEFRTIEVLVKKDAVQAAIQAPTITSAGSAKVFWGPLMATGSIELQGSSNQFYPRKLARGAIEANGGYPDRDTNASAPNTDGREWWSYNEPPGVPEPPAVDLDHYRTQAQAETDCPAGGTPAGSCYYTSNQNFDNLKSTIPKAYFFEADAKFTGSKHFRGWLIVMDDLEMTGGGQGLDGAIEYGDYTAAVPLNAYKEYQKNTPNQGDNCLAVGGLVCNGGGSSQDDDGDYDNADKAEADDECCHQYPGDEGLQTTVAYHFKNGCPTAGHGNNTGGAPNESIHFKGFAYVRGNSKIAGSTSIHGALLSDSGSFTGSGSFTLFYDDMLEIEMTSGNFVQTSWKELPGKTF